MRDTEKKKILIIALISITIVLLDQLTKFFAVVYLPYTQNTGAGFGLFPNSTSILIWISIIVIGLIFYLSDKIPEKKYTQVSVALILGGTIANLIDRIRLGSVIDFIDLKIWPSFNIADAAITVGVIGLIFYLMKNK